MAWSEEELRATPVGAAYFQQRGIARVEQAQAAAHEEAEVHLLARVLRLAREHGWLCYHTHDSRRSEEGFPDLVLVRECVIFAELKSRIGKPTAAQLRWLTMLSNAGIEAYLWRPADWDAIAARLTRIWRK